MFDVEYIVECRGDRRVIISHPYAKDQDDEDQDGYDQDVQDQDDEDEDVQDQGVQDQDVQDQDVGHVLFPWVMLPPEQLTGFVALLAKYSTPEECQQAAETRAEYQLWVQNSQRLARERADEKQHSAAALGNATQQQAQRSFQGTSDCLSLADEGAPPSKIFKPGTRASQLTGDSSSAGASRTDPIKNNRLSAKLMVVKTQSAQGPPLAANSSIGPGTQLGALRVSQPIILWPYPLTLLGLFRLLPLELKIMVFDFALRGTWHGRVPPLIRALRTRGTKDLYDLATTSFIDGNTYRIRQNNGWGFDDMQIKSIARIQEMSIDIGKALHAHLLKLDQSFFKNGRYQKDICRKLNLKTLHLHDIKREIQESELIAFVEHSFDVSTSLSDLIRKCGTLETVIMTTYCTGLYVDTQIQNMNMSCHKIGRLKRVSTGETLIWFWRLKPGDDLPRDYSEEADKI